MNRRNLTGLGIAFAGAGMASVWVSASQGEGAILPRVWTLGLFVASWAAFKAREVTILSPWDRLTLPVATFCVGMAALDLVRAIAEGRGR